MFDPIIFDRFSTREEVTAAANAKARETGWDCVIALGREGELGIFPWHCFTDDHQPCGISLQMGFVWQAHIAAPVPE